MRLPIRSAFLVLASLLILTGSGCVITLQARAYNLDTAEVVNAKIKYTGSGKGPIEFTLPSGEVCAGEYVTVAGGSTGWGSVFTTLYSGTGTATASGSSFGGSIENKQKGSAIVTCPEGRVFDCEYVTSAWTAQGYGACKDNRDQRFKLMF